jgi:arginine/lysine/ornithine decarboxylase
METLLQKLRTYANSPAIPMHMPGHKRNTALAPYLGLLGAGLDITEITGFDNLHDPQEVFRESMELASRLWGSGRSFFLS